MLGGQAVQADGASALRLEDPRLPLMMAAPQRRRARGRSHLRPPDPRPGIGLPLGELAAPRGATQPGPHPTHLHQLQLRLGLAGRLGLAKV